MHLRFWVCVITFLFLCCKQKSPSNFSATTSDLNSTPHFSLIPASESQVDFQNTLTEGLNTNILMYEYFYNGGGVAAADFNQDGLIDIYFSGNMVDNKLYLNRGNLKFEDITLLSKVEGRPGPWKTGVTAVDINGDRLMDLYVCYSGALPTEKRMNQLFINQGNNARGIPVFEDQAALYGLNSPAYSTQAYFFDYDLDHDLDMLLLNHNPKNLPILNEESTAALLKADDLLKGTRLFRQDLGRFKDITVQAGINGSTLSYGLGLAIADLNQDGWPDFYISNDYAVPDYLYVNNKNGTFTNVLSKSIGHTSQFSMGNEVADINNDGHQDLFTLDMLPEDNYRQKLLLAPDNYNKFELNVRSGFYYQYMRNMLQLNQGTSTASSIVFAEIGQLAGISNTDWSWSALLADYDDDGLQDLHITNGYRRDYTNLDFINYMDQYTKEKGRLVREDVMEIISHMPASNVSNYIYANQDGLQFIDVTKAWGLHRPSNSNGAAHADLDNDGDLDLIVNNINEPAFIYRNEAQRNADHSYLNINLKGTSLNTLGLGSKISITADGHTQYIDHTITRGYQSSVSPVIHFGLGKAKLIDTLIIQWPGGDQQILTQINGNQTIELDEVNASKFIQRTIPSTTLFQSIQSPIPYMHVQRDINDFDRQPLLIQKPSYVGPYMASGDLNGDRLEDIIVGGSKDQRVKIYFQQNNRSYILDSLNSEMALSYDGPLALWDADNDKDLDLYIASGGYHDLQIDSSLQDYLLLNDSHGRFTRSANSLPAMPTSKGCVVPIDINLDGHMDVFVGSRVIPGRYPENPASYLLINDTHNKFTNNISTLAPELEHIGMITDALSLDLNQDQKNDLIVVGEWLPISVFMHEGNKLVNRTSTYFDKEYRGWWNKIAASDFNNDGKPDLIVGNVGTNMQFHATDLEPAELYYKDFDKNGSVDPLFCTYIQGKSYPYITRDELVKQLVTFRRRFTSFESYASITITDLFKKDELKTSGHRSINRMETTCFISQPSGNYAIKELPIQAQFSPVHTIIIQDLDRDGIEDLLLCGNNANFKIRLGKSDSNHGMVFKGLGQGAFSYVNQSASGLNIRGDVRSVLVAGPNFLFGINHQPLQAYKLKL